MSMRINADEIVSVLTEEISRYRDKIEPKEVGRDSGGRRRHRARLRPVERDGRRDGRVHAHRRARPGLQPGRELGRRHHSRRLPRASPRATRSAPPAACLQVPVGEALIGRVVDPLGNPARRQGPDRHDAHAAASNRSRPAWPAGSRWKCRCRPASRPSTP